MIEQDHAQRLASVKARRDELDAKFRSYDGGDRPMSPPVSLIRDLARAEERVREIEAEPSATSGPPTETAK
jgi:hypothetical protein